MEQNPQNKKWKFEDGDYRRDMHYRKTKNHIKGRRKKIFLVRVLLIILYIIVVAAAAYFIIVD